MPTETITAGDTLDLLKDRHAAAWIDVRSEVEFAEGAIPRFENLPILTQAERHEVGLIYKQQGQQAAIALGHRITAPHRAARTRTWVDRIAASPASEGIVACWRGGLRSQLAADWISTELTCGRVRRVEGGYKELRHLLLERFSAPNPLIVLGGNTGSGKTRFLKSLTDELAVVDLEGMARHRGSSFGKLWDNPQPSQATFENALGLSLWREGREILVEDESVCIGSVHLPQPFWDRMRRAPLILMRRPIHERVHLLHDEYVLEPLAQGRSPEEVQSVLERDLEALRRRLGGLRTDQLKSALRKAMETGDPQMHSVWIEGLLRDYYDPMYEYGRSRFDRPVLFEGDPDACREFLEERARRGMNSA